MLQPDSEVETNHFLCTPVLVILADGFARLCGAFGGRRFGWQTSLRRVHTPYACDDRSECHATRFAVSAEAVNVVMTESVGKTGTFQDSKRVGGMKLQFVFCKIKPV